MTITREQTHVERLLAQIQDRVGELERLRAHGFRGRALAEREHELSLLRGQLARIVARRGEEPARATTSSLSTAHLPGAPRRAA